MIHNGADFTVKNKDGKTASEIANEKGISRNERKFYYFKSHDPSESFTQKTVTILLGFAELARVLQENVAQKGKMVL